MSDTERPPGPARVDPEPVAPEDPERLAHLAAHRGLIVRRSLLATALGGIVPVPVMDEYVASRVHGGLLIKLAEQRQVDLPPSSAEVLSDPKEATLLRHATITAITLVALKLAWRKFFALLAAGRGADEMASTFQFSTLFDHYCARIHVGGAIDRRRAAELRVAIHETVELTEKATLVAVFRDGGKILGRSLLEAPRWMTRRISSLARRWVSSRGDVAATFDPAAEVAAEGETKWLDRAAGAVEERLGTLGNDYLVLLVDDFERRWAMRQAAAAARAAAGSTEAAAAGNGAPDARAPGGQPDKPRPDGTD
jgi:hypothetical protein